MTLQTKAPKPKACAVCKTQFTPRLMAAKVCSPICGLTKARADREKKQKLAEAQDKRETKAKLEKLKSKSTWAKEAQTAFNRFIRLRDVDKPCISCGRHHKGQYHAGHYLSIGARPEIRFVELNVHKQCAPCNNHLSGNAVLYRKALIDLIGLVDLEWLEGPHPTRHYTTDELKAIKADYTARVRELHKGMV